MYAISTNERNSNSTTQPSHRGLKYSSVELVKRNDTACALPCVSAYGHPPSNTGLRQKKSQEHRWGEVDLRERWQGISSGGALPTRRICCVSWSVRLVITMLGRGRRGLCFWSSEYFPKGHCEGIQAMAIRQEGRGVSPGPRAGLR